MSEGTLKNVLSDDFVVVKDEAAGNISVAAFGAENVPDDVGGELARLSFTAHRGTLGQYSEITFADAKVGEATGVRDLTIGNKIKISDGIIKVTALDAPPEGKRFAGWLGSNNRRYDDRMLVFNLAGEGEVFVLTPIWK